jgi:hypothetical protein
VPYSQIEQRYMDMIVEGYFPTTPTEPAPEEPSLDGVQLAAAPSKTRTDAPAGAGLPKAPTTPEQAAEMMRNMPLATQSEMIMRRIAEDQKAGVVGSVIPKDMTLREKLASGMQQMLIDNAGMDNVRARRLAQTMFGGESSGAPLGIGLVDVTPFVIPLAAQEAGISAGEAREAAQAGEYGQAALSYGTGVLQGLDVVPGVALAAKGGKALGEALAPAAADVMEKYLTKTGAILKMAPDSPGIEVKSAPKLNTPAFKNWFGNSKVVDEKGKPIVVYHGTKAAVSDDFAFDRKKNITAADFYFTPNKETASIYGAPIPVYLKAENLIDIRPDNIEAKEANALQKVFKLIGEDYGFDDFDSFVDVVTGGRMYEVGNNQRFQNAVLGELNNIGFDGVRMVDAGFGGALDESIVVFNSAQIKSVFNKGTFDPKDPRILYGGGVAGVATAGEEKK